MPAEQQMSRRQVTKAARWASHARTLSNLPKDIPRLVLGSLPLGAFKRNMPHFMNH